MSDIFGFGPSDPEDSLLTPEQQEILDAKVFVRNDDGTLSPAEPIPFSPGIDWEVMPLGPFYMAQAWEGAVCLRTVYARSRFGLRWKIRRAHRRLMER